MNTLFTNCEQEGKLDKKKRDCFITEIDIIENIITINWHENLRPFFGSVKLYIEDGKLKMETEGMSKEFVKYLLGLMIDRGEITDV